MRHTEDPAPSSSFVPKLSIYRSSESYHSGQFSSDFPSAADRPRQWQRASTDVNTPNNGGRPFQSKEEGYPTHVDPHDRRDNHASSHNTSQVNSHTGSTMNDMSGKQDHSSPTPRHGHSALFGTAPKAESLPTSDPTKRSQIYDAFTIHRNSPIRHVRGPLSGHRFRPETREPLGDRLTHRRRSSPPARVQRTRRGDAPKAAMADPSTSSASASSSSSISGDGSSGEESVLFDMDAEAVVPPEVLSAAPVRAFHWARHPRHPIVWCLLQARGMSLPRHADLVEYHMAEGFLHHVDLCCHGSYFVHYKARRTPHERYFSIRMLPRDMTARNSDRIPYLAWTMHRSGVQVIGCVPLADLVGITVSLRSVAFQPHLASSRTINGPRVGSHRPKLPVDGAFSLWFFNRRQQLAQSVDLLTCNPMVLDVWTKTFKGLVSVNSSSVVQVPLTSDGDSAELTELTRVAQQQQQEQQQQQHASRGVPRSSSV